MQFSKSSFTLIACALIFYATALHAAESDDYSLTDLDGNRHSLSQYRGKWVVLNFWATWCTPCLREMPELESFYQNNKHNNATVLGVTFEATPIDKIRMFVLILGVTYPILSSGQNPITPFGEVRVLPTTFIIDPAGNLFHKIEGSVTEKDLQHIIDEANLTTVASTTVQ